MSTRHHMPPPSIVTIVQEFEAFTSVNAWHL